MEMAQKGQNQCIPKSCPNMEGSLEEIRQMSPAGNSQLTIVFPYGGRNMVIKT